MVVFLLPDREMLFLLLLFLVLFIYFTLSGYLVPQFLELSGASTGFVLSGVLILRA